MKPYAALLFIIVSFLFTSCESQKTHDIEDLKDPAFDSTYVEVATTVAAVDLEKALWKADSLLSKSDNIYQEMKTLMLFATLHLRSGKEDTSLAYAEQAADLADNGGFVSWQVRIAGFLSSTYRNVGLTTEARRYLRKAETLNARLKDSASYYTTQLMLHQEKSYFLIEEDREYNAALQELEKAQKVWTRIHAREKRVFQATTYQMMGECYLHLDELVLAEKFLRESLRIMEEHPSGLVPFVWKALGDVEMKRRNYEEGLKNYLTAEQEIQNSYNFNAQISLEASFMNYYAVIEDEKSELLHRTRYLELVDKKRKKTKAISNALISLLNDNKAQNKDMGSILLYVAVALLSSTFILLLIIFLSKEKKKRSIIVQTSLPTTSESQDKLAIAKETEERLLKNIEKLEAQEFYLQKSVSSSSLASQLNTNTKYIAHIINKYKEKDFKTYVNELRIQKFLKDIQEHPKILNYKFSYIAAQYGFSSQRSFTNAFKEQMQQPPSEYINKVKESRKEPPIKKIV